MHFIKCSVIEIRFCPGLANRIPSVDMKFQLVRSKTSVTRMQNKKKNMERFVHAKTKQILEKIAHGYLNIMHTHT